MKKSIGYIFSYFCIHFGFNEMKRKKNHSVNINRTFLLIFSRPISMKKHTKNEISIPMSRLSFEMRKTKQICHASCII